MKRKTGDNKMIQVVRSITVLLLSTSLVVTGANRTFNASLEEGSQPGTLIFDIRTHIDVRTDETRFALLYDQRDGQLFNLDPTLGTLKSRIVIHRETIQRSTQQSSACETDECVVEVLVQVTSKTGDLPQVYTIKISILDKNNYAPEFRIKENIVKISENTEIDSKIILPFLVYDRDSPRFSVKRLELISAEEDKGIFDIDPQQLNTYEKEYRIGLVIKKNLDREVKETYSLTLKAIDGGQIPKTSTLSFVVQVKDENDNYPEWITKQFNFSISENTPPGTVIVQLQASDKDAGPNGQVHYSFCEPQPSRDVPHNFELDISTGELKVKRGARLDFESQKTYRIPVMAQDLGRVPKQREAIVIVNLEDFNDEEPKITVKPQDRTRSPYVMENKPPGELVCTIIVTDKDSGLNGQVNCRPSTNKFELRKVLESTGSVVYHLISKETFDREKTQLVREIVECVDKGTPSKSSTQSIDVDILDENDCPPEFSKDSKFYKLFFAEEQEPHTRIGVIKAEDKDEGPPLAYTLDSEGEKIVTIGKNTGLVSSKIRFDREIQDLYKFNVYVTDKIHTASAAVELHIQDINDHSPEWIQPFRLEIKENSRMYSKVGDVKAVDKDINENGKIEYIIRPPHPYFDIKPFGEIYTKSEYLDREHTASFKVNVTAHDFGRPMRAKSEIIEIFILDENDNKPIFTYPTYPNNRINISCKEPIKSVLVRVRANDSDSGENGRVTFNITPTTWSSYFDIHPEYGDISLVKPLSCDTYNQISLKIKATDHGNPPNSQVMVIIIDPSSRSPIRYNNPPGDSNLNHIPEDPNLTAIVGLIIATFILVVILVFAICLLRRKTLRATNLAKTKHRQAEMARSASMPPPNSHKLEHTLLKKSLTQDRNMFNPSPPPYYYTCEPRLAEEREHYLLMNDLGHGHGYQTLRYKHIGDERADYSRIPDTDTEQFTEITTAQVCGRGGSQDALESPLKRARIDSSDQLNTDRKRSVTLDHRQLKAPYCTVSFV